MRNNSQRTEWDDWLPTKSFVHDSTDIGQLVHVLERRQTITTNDSVDLGLSLRLDLGVHDKREEERDDGRDSLSVRNQYDISN
jgi:hypothetical protein